MKIDKYIKIIENLINIGSEYEFKIYDALKMDNVAFDSNKINGIASVIGGSVEPISELGSSSLDLDIEFTYPQERNDYVKERLIKLSKDNAGLVIENSQFDEDSVGTTGINIIFPIQGNYKNSTLGETMQSYILCSFDINDKAVLANDEKLFIEKDFNYEIKDVDEETVGNYFINRNIVIDDTIDMQFIKNPVQPTIEEFDNAGIIFKNGSQTVLADYSHMGNKLCFRVDSPINEDYVGKCFYSWYDGEINGIEYEEGLNEYRQYKKYLFSDLVENYFGTDDIYKIIYNNGKVYCGGLNGKFSVYDINTNTFGALIETPFSLSPIYEMVYHDSKIYCSCLFGKFAIYDISTNTFGELINNPFNLSSKTIFSMIYHDGKIYCGGEGFSIYNIETNTFSSKINIDIRTMVYHDGKIYCGKIGGGFIIYDIYTETFSTLIDNPFGVNSILSMVYYNDKIYCGGQNGKFAIYTISSNEFSDLIENPFALNSIHSVIYNNGKIYCSGQNGRFSIYKILENEFTLLIENPFISNTIYSIIYNDNEIYYGGGAGKFCKSDSENRIEIVPITNTPTYNNSQIEYSNMWHIMKNFVKYTGKDKYIEVELPQNYLQNKYENFYEKIKVWERILFYKNVLTRHRLSNTNKYKNFSEMQTINNGQSFSISLAVPSIKGSVINDIKDDLILGYNINKKYNLKIKDESGEKVFENMVVSGEFEKECTPGSPIVLKILFVYGRT